MTTTHELLKSAEAMREVLEEALQDEWNDWCADTGHVPDAFRIHGPPTTQVSADFSSSAWVRHVADRMTVLIEARGD